MSTGLLSGDFGPNTGSPVSPISETMKNQVLAIELTDMTSNKNSKGSALTDDWSMYDGQDVEETNINNGRDTGDTADPFIMSPSQSEIKADGKDRDIPGDGKSSIDDYSTFSPRAHSSVMSDQSSELDITIPESRASQELQSTRGDYYCVDHMCLVTDEVYDMLSYYIQSTHRKQPCVLTLKVVLVKYTPHHQVKWLLYRNHGRRPSIHPAQSIIQSPVHIFVIQYCYIEGQGHSNPLNLVSCFYIHVHVIHTDVSLCLVYIFVIHSWISRSFDRID